MIVAFQVFINLIVFLKSPIIDKNFTIKLECGVIILLWMFIIYQIQSLIYGGHIIVFKEEIKYQSFSQTMNWVMDNAKVKYFVIRMFTVKNWRKNYMVFIIIQIQKVHIINILEYKSMLFESDYTSKLDNYKSYLNIID